jgi:hypothetical protein
MISDNVRPSATALHFFSQAEIVTVDRPFRCASGSCKCCCYQEATFSSGGAELGRAKEVSISTPELFASVLENHLTMPHSSLFLQTCWFCVPSLKVFDHTGNQLYLVHPPTCCGGCCVNCCAEGNPCGKGCCKESFRIFPADAGNTNGDAPYLGMIMKKPKSFGTVSTLLCLPLRFRACLSLTTVAWD